MTRVRHTAWPRSTSASQWRSGLASCAGRTHASRIGGRAVRNRPGARRAELSRAYATSGPEFGLACLAGAISVVLLLAAVGLVGSDDAAPLWGWQARVGVVLAIWLVVGPLTETVRAATRRTG